MKKLVSLAYSVVLLPLIGYSFHNSFNYSGEEKIITIIHIFYHFLFILQNFTIAKKSGIIFLAH